MIKVPNITAVSDLESAGKRIYNRIHLILEDDVDLTKEPEIIVSDEARTMAALTLKQGRPSHISTLPSLRRLPLHRAAMAT